MVKRYVKRYNPYAGKKSRRMLSVVPISKKAARKGKSLVRQVKALIASKKKDAADVARNTTTAAPGVTTSACLTSSTAYSTAASGTGLLDMDGDECLINSVHIKGRLICQNATDADPVGGLDNLVRKILVWYNKPLLVASAAGTLPPITEVLITDDIASLRVTSNANGGRFTVLSDKTWTLGMNLGGVGATIAYAAVGAAATNKMVDYRVKINKTTKFAVPSVSGTPAGHYDSDIGPGRIDRGLLVMYTLYSNNQVLIDNTVTRLNYTG